MRKQSGSAVQYFVWKWIGWPSDPIRELSHSIAYRIWSVELVNEVRQEQGQGELKKISESIGDDQF